MYPKRLTQKVICDPASAIVETKAGKVRGLVTEGTYIFRGIKYADAKRFEEPKPVQPGKVSKELMPSDLSLPRSQP